MDQQQNQQPYTPQSSPPSPQTGGVPQQYPQTAGPLPPQSNQPSGSRQGGEVTGQVKTNPNSTQNSLLISEIRDGVAIMKDGSYRAVVLAQSINFDLMSPQEREGVEVAFQGFLNSLYFPVQIMMRSQRVDLRTYLGKLNKVKEGQDSVLRSLLMEDYIAYIEYLAQTANIMDKQFFVVIPYDPPLTQGITNKTSKFTNVFNRKTDMITINEKDFIDAKTELKNRVQAVLESMNQMGVQAIPLNTQELIELYYDVYNPDTATSQPLVNHSQLEGAIVTKGEGENPRGGQS